MQKRKGMRENFVRTIDVMQHEYSGANLIVCILWERQQDHKGLGADVLPVARYQTVTKKEMQSGEGG